MPEDWACKFWGTCHPSRGSMLAASAQRFNYINSQIAALIRKQLKSEKVLFLNYIY